MAMSTNCQCHIVCIVNQQVLAKIHTKAMEPTPNTSKNVHNPRRKRKKPFNHTRKNAQKRNNFKKKTKLAMSMYSWAENFTIAATWQLKHQVAYWKAKATALEYENKVLHDVIRKNCGGSSAVSSQNCSEEESVQSDDNEMCEDTGTQNEEGDFEVSEEFIEFLRANAKYKEDARREREKLKANEENLRIEEEAGPSNTEEPEDREEMLKRLYGDDWQRIGALEMSVQSTFIDECDKQKAVYWPNIPFNFNFS